LAKNRDCPINRDDGGKSDCAKAWI